MSELTENLEKLLKKAALDGALTEGAIDQFHALVTERNALKKDNGRLDDLNTELDEKVNHLNSRASAAETCAQEWAGREQDLMDREGKCNHLEMEAKYQGLRVEDHKEMFKTVFRNSVLRKGVMTPVSAGPVDQYGTKQADSYPSHDTVEEEEI